MEIYLHLQLQSQYVCVCVCVCRVWSQILKYVTGTAHWPNDLHSFLFFLWTYVLLHRLKLDSTRYFFYNLTRRACTFVSGVPAITDETLWSPCDSFHWLQLSMFWALSPKINWFRARRAVFLVKRDSSQVSYFTGWKERICDGFC